MGLPKLRLIMIAVSLWGNPDKPEFGQPHEEILMLIIWNYLVIYNYLH